MEKKYKLSKTKMNGKSDSFYDSKRIRKNNKDCSHWGRSMYYDYELYPKKDRMRGILDDKNSVYNSSNLESESYDFGAMDHGYKSIDLRKLRRKDAMLVKANPRMAERVISPEEKERRYRQAYFARLNSKK